MSHGKSFVKHAVVFGLGAVSIQLASIVLLPLYTRYLDPAEYGVLQLLYRIGEVLRICLMFPGIHLATLNFWGKAESDKDRNHIAASVGLFTLVVLAVASLVIALGAGSLADRLGLEDHRLLAVGTIAILLQATTYMPLALKQARLESMAYVAASVGISLCQITLCLLSVAVFEWGLWGILAAMCVTNVCFGLGLTLQELHRGSIVPRWSQLVEVAKFSAPFVPSGLCFFVLHSGDQFFLVRNAGAAVLGIYALGYRLTQGVVMLGSQPLCQVWSSRMYQVYKDPHGSVKFGHAITRIMTVYLFVGTGTVLFRKELLLLFGSAKFADAESVLGPLVLAHFFLVLSNLFDGAFYVKRRTDLKPWVALTATVVMIIAYATLIPRYQAIGAAYATLIGFAFLSAATLFVAQRVFFVHVEFRRLATIFSLSVAIAAVGYCFPDVNAANVLMRFVFLGCFPAILWHGNILTTEEKCFVSKELRNLLARLVAARHPAAPAESKH